MDIQTYIHTDIHTYRHIKIFISKIVTKTVGNLCKSGSVKIKVQFSDNVIKINSSFELQNIIIWSCFLSAGWWTGGVETATRWVGARSRRRVYRAETGRGRAGQW